MTAAVASPPKRTVRLWTIQRSEKWEEALQKGFLASDGQRINNEDHRSAYRWLIDQMGQRIPGYTGQFPVWAWTENPDLRESGHLLPDECGVCVEFTVRADQVLFSDFDAWNRRIWGKYPCLFDPDWDDPDWQLPENPAILPEEIDESWEEIFELTQAKMVQAMVGVVPLRDVVRVTYFTAF